MELIVSHQQPDFDALAATVLARLLHPGAKAVIVGRPYGDVRDFMHLYRDALDLDDMDALELSAVKSLVVVDTASAERLGEFADLARRVPVTVYDHHPKDGGDVAAVAGVHREVGSTVTILALMLQARKIHVPAALATVGLLGIHTDTGHLTYPHTHRDDHVAAAYLLDCGASLETVARFSKETYNFEQRVLFTDLLNSAQIEALPTGSVVVATATREDYIADVAPMAHELLSLYSAEVALVILRMADKTLLIARARPGFDVAKVLREAFAGGGHASAAFASTNVSIADAKTQVLERLAKQGHALTAKDLMSTPVKTIPQDASAAEAARLLERYGHNGVPVMQQGELVGMVSSRDINRALRHDLGHVPVSSIMTKDVITATEDTSKNDLEARIIDHNIGRLPIVRRAADGTSTVIGIVTRSDLIAHAHADKPSDGDPQHLAQTVLKRLPTALTNTIERASHVARMQAANHPNVALYVVGGTVRDALIGRSSDDLDFVLEHADVPTFVKALQEYLGGDISCHDAFGTCTLALESGVMVDVATARDEYYRHPGALPSVAQSNLPRDLARRDFTINTLALKLYPEPQILIDRHGALRDLDSKVLRTLHPLSFVEDPTRIVRAARLAGRLGFRLSAATREQMQRALEPSVLKHVSQDRLMSELRLACQETQVLPALEPLVTVGALEAMYNVQLTDAVRGMIACLDRMRIRAANRRTALMTPAANPVADADNTDTATANEDTPAATDITTTDITTDVTTDGISVDFASELAYAPSDAEDGLSESYLLALMLAQNQPDPNQWTKKRVEMHKLVRQLLVAEVLEEDVYQRLSPAAKQLLFAARSDFRAQASQLEHVPPRRKLRGQDVLELGLESGPAVGKVLAQVAAARKRGELTQFADELDLAKRIVAQWQAGDSVSEEKA